MVCDDGRLETSVIINILDHLDDGFSRQPVSDGVLPRPAFPVFSGRTGTSERIAPIGFDLSERGHGFDGSIGNDGSYIHQIPAAVRDRRNRLLLRTIWRDCRRGPGISIHGSSRAIGPRVLPQSACNWQRIDFDTLPPRRLVTMLVQLSVVDTAHRDSELVTDFAPERAWTRTTIGANCSIGQNVMIVLNVRVGNGCKIQNNVAIYDGVEPADDLFCGPTCVFTSVNNPCATGI